MRSIQTCAASSRKGKIMTLRTEQESAPAAARLDKYGYNSIGKHIVGGAIMTAVLLFLGAGTLQWDWGWAFIAVTFIGWMALSLVLARVNPELLNARGKRFKALTGTKRWDWIITLSYSALVLLTPFVAGLDYANGWSAPSSDAIKIVGLALLLLGFGVLTWAMAVNRFFEATVRIQTQRGHQVVASGPYRYVRHPGYIGVMLQMIAVPLSLGMFAALIPALITVALFIVRTALEDRALIAELPGYADFAQRTRYRLVPGLW
jgi:protein-S-isoprenylcysteine O-methyltransferase Ste14